MDTGHLVDQTIERIRSSAIAELRTIANGNSQETMTSEEIVDWVLRRTSDELKEALNGYLDGQNEQDSWWDGYDSVEFTEVFRGGMPEDGLLPRYKKDVHGRRNR
jgi:hypothetical protein